MGEEVRIVINQESQGTGARDAARDLHEVETAANRAAAAVQKQTDAMRQAGQSHAGQRNDPMRAEAARFMADEEKRIAASANGTGSKQKESDASHEASLTKQIALSTQLEAMSLRASGDVAGAQALEREVEVMERSLTLQRTLNVGRSDADKLAKQMVADEAKLATAAAEKLAAEKAVTAQMAEQAAFRGKFRQAAGGAATFGGEVASGGTGYGGLMQLGRVGGPIGMIAAIGAAITGALFRTSAQENDRDITAGNRAAEEREKSERRVRLQRTWRGSSSEAGEMAFSAEQRVKDLQEQRAELEHQAQQKWYAPSTWTWFGLRKNEGQRGLEANAAELSTAANEARAARDAQRWNVDNGEVGLELRMAQATAQHTVGGVKDRVEAEQTLMYLREYKRLMRETNDDTIAHEGALVKVKEAQYQLGLRASSGLVTAMSGGADIARAAQLTASTQANQESVRGSIDALHETVKNGQPRKQFAKPPLE